MRHLIVDGYNVLHADPRYEALAARDLDLARARLVEDVAAFAAGSWRPVVVFDGSGNAAADGRPHHVAGVTVMFSRAGEDADAVIEALAHRFRQSGEVAVATSDAATQQAVAGRGVRRLSARELVVEMDLSRRERGEAARPGSRRGPVEERVDASVREALSRWARGQKGR